LQFLQSRQALGVAPNGNFTLSPALGLLRVKPRDQYLGYCLDRLGSRGFSDFVSPPSPPERRARGCPVSFVAMDEPAWTEPPTPARLVSKPAQTQAARIGGGIGRCQDGAFRVATDFSYKK